LFAAFCRAMTWSLFLRNFFCCSYSASSKVYLSALVRRRKSRFLIRGNCRQPRLHGTLLGAMISSSAKSVSMRPFPNRPGCPSALLAPDANISWSFARFSSDWSFGRLFRIFQEWDNLHTRT
jgi:hypothetical protein